METRVLFPSEGRQKARQGETRQERIKAKEKQIGNGFRRFIWQQRIGKEAGERNRGRKSKKEAKKEAEKETERNRKKEMKRKRSRSIYGE